MEQDPKRHNAQLLPCSRFSPAVNHLLTRYGECSINYTVLLV